MTTHPWPPAGLPTPYYVDEACVLFHAKAEDLLPLFAAGSVDLVLTDPPYFRVKEDDWDRQWANEAAYLDWLRGLCAEWYRLLAPNGSLYCFASALMAWSAEGVLRERFRVLNRITWLKEEGWHNKAEKASARQYLSPWEAILFAEQCASDTTADEIADYTAISTALHKQVYAPIARYLQHERERAGFTRDAVDVGLGYVRTKDPTRGTELCRRWEEGSSLPTKETYERYRQLLNNGHTSAYLRQEYADLRQEYADLRRPFFLTAQEQWTDVWKFRAVTPATDKHPCEKPLPLLRHILRISSRPDAVILDCCAGSGSTLEAAKHLGRRAIGIEISQTYCAMAAQRLRQEVLPLRQAHGGNDVPIAQRLFA